MFHRAWPTCERPKGVQIGFQDEYGEAVSTELLIDGKAYWICTEYSANTTVIFPMFQIGPWVFDLFPNYWRGVQLGEHKEYPLAEHMKILARIEKEGAYWNAV